MACLICEANTGNPPLATLSANSSCSPFVSPISRREGAMNGLGISAVVFFFRDSPLDFLSPPELTRGDADAQVQPAFAI
jgi:hypothetical protein